MSSRLIPIFQIFCIPFLLILACGLDYWRLAASYDVAAMRWSFATFVAITFPQIILIIALLLVGYVMILMKPSLRISAVYIVVGSYIALMPGFLISAYAHPSEIRFIPNLIAYPSIFLTQGSTNSLLSMAASALLSVGLLGLARAMYVKFK